MVKDAVPLGGLRRALIVKLGHPGEVLLATPVLGALKAHAPQLELDALTDEESEPILSGHPGVARVFTVRRGWRNELRLYKDLRARRYDLLVHLSEHARGAWLGRGLGVRYSVAPARADKLRFWRKSFTHLYPVVRGGRRHRVELNLDALRRIGVQPDPSQRKVLFVPGAQAESRVRTLVEPPFVHMHPASGAGLKCWPAACNAELIDRLSAESNRIVITGAPDELAFIAEIVQKVNRAQPLNLAGQLTIRELGALSARARLFIGVNSIPMHLAAAMGTPTVAFFGPGGEIEWGPWNVERRIVPFTHSVDAVHAAARELLGQSRSA